MYIYMYIHTYVYIYVYIYMYTSIERERERERDQSPKSQGGGYTGDLGFTAFGFGGRGLQAGACGFRLSKFHP